MIVIHSKTLWVRKFLAAGNNVVGDCVAEVTTLRFGLNLAQSFGCSRLIINSDNSDMIVAMQDGGTFLGLAAAIWTIVII